jgi:hypothetical protein
VPSLCDARLPDALQVLQYELYRVNRRFTRNENHCRRVRWDLAITYTFSRQGVPVWQFAFWKFNFGHQASEPSHSPNLCSFLGRLITASSFAICASKSSPSSAPSLSTDFSPSPPGADCGQTSEAIYPVSINHKCVLFGSGGSHRPTQILGRPLRQPVSLYLLYKTPRLQVRSRQVLSKSRYHPMRAVKRSTEREFRRILLTERNRRPFSLS